jgi:hypothetical protein
MLVLLLYPSHPATCEPSDGSSSSIGAVTGTRRGVLNHASSQARAARRQGA